MKIVIYEDNYRDFCPLINLYPQFKLRIGMKTIAENISTYFPGSRFGYLGRAIFKFENLNQSGPQIYLSSRLLLLKRFAIPKQDTKLLVNEHIVGFIKYQPPFPKDQVQIDQTMSRLKKTQKISGLALTNLWDLIKYNEPVLVKHFASHPRKGKNIKQIEIIGEKSDLFVASDAEIHSFVSIDVTRGPVYIDQGAKIRAFSTIVGPAYIGKGTIIDRAKIVKSSIGPHCRIGGEVDSCIFQGYANKHHEGFIGNSFIGEWVNLGALTTNSDLKNNYSSVRIKVGRKEFDSGLVKLGCFIGDHTKTGIGTLIPTGAVIGSFVNFFGGGTMPGYVPNFKWLSTKRILNHRLEPAIKTARFVMQRRNVRMTKHYEDLIRILYRQ